MNYNIALVRGDGIGPEIVDSAVRVLEKVGEKFGHTFSTTPYLAGGSAIDACGIPLPDQTVQGCDLLRSESQAGDDFGRQPGWFCKGQNENSKRDKRDETIVK